MNPPPSSNAQAIILIEDDPDDVDIFRATLAHLGVERPLRVFGDGDAAYQYLEAATEMFGVIFCDFRLVRDSGLDLRARIAKNERLHKLAIPFILLTNGMPPSAVEKAYEQPIQGVFAKETSLERSAKQVETILAYWSLAMTPSAPQPSYEWTEEA